MGICSNAYLVFGIELKVGEIIRNPTDYLIDYQDELLNNTPYQIETCGYCDDENPLYILSIKSKFLDNCIGEDLTTIEPNFLIVSQEEIDAFKKFCVKMNLPGLEPKWYLTGFIG